MWSNPCVLEGDELPDIEVLSPRSRVPGSYRRYEVVSLITDPRIPADRRIFNALMLLTGMRHGEASGLRWRMIDETMEPLQCIELRTQYDGKPLKGKGEAGGKPRNIPVHPVLAFLLAEWRASGFAQVYGRAPTADDFIVPTRKKGQRLMSFRKPGTSLKAHYEDCERVGIVARRDHDHRHTFASLTDDDGARREVIEKVTHNAKGTMLEHYTHRAWTTVCTEVAKLRIDLFPLAAPAEYRAEEPPPAPNHLFFAGKVATPTGSAQCETRSNLLNSAASEALGEVLGAVRLVA